MNKIAISIGFIQIYWYSIFIFLGMLFAIIVVLKEANKKNINEDFIINLIFYGLIIGIIGARLYYVLFNLNYYLSNPIEIIEVWNGGLAIHGGILSALLFLIFYSKKNNIKIINLTDIIVVGLFIGQAIGRWGNFFNQEAYGIIVSKSSLSFLPDFIINGMYINGQYRQPTFLIESISCLLGFITILLIRKFYKKLKVGNLTSFYLIWYGIERLIVEHFRADSLMLGPIKIAQIVSILFITFGIIILIKSNKNELYNKEDLCVRK